MASIILNLQLTGPPGIPGSSIPATTSSLGAIQLSGDLGGTAPAPVLENTINVRSIVQNDAIPLIIGLG